MLQNTLKSRYGKKVGWSHEQVLLHFNVQKSITPERKIRTTNHHNSEPYFCFNFKIKIIQCKLPYSVLFHLQHIFFN